MFLSREEASNKQRHLCQAGISPLSNHLLSMPSPSGGGLEEGDYLMRNEKRLIFFSAMPAPLATL